MNIETAIKWFNDRNGKVYYSMNYRNGQKINASGQLSSSGRPGYDCSSAVYYALVASKHFPSNIWHGNTESLFGDLEKHGWTKVKADKTGFIPAKRGDVFIWGVRGQSGGAFGHTGIFTSADNIIHCAYGYNGIHIDNHDTLWAINGRPAVTIYRYTGKPVPPSNSETDQILSVGSTIKFTKTYKVDDLKVFNGVWQVRTNELCKNDFTWTENGIPVAPLTEVDKDGYATSDQTLSKGSLYKFAGKYKVLGLGQYKGHWLVMIEHAGLKWWVDAETSTEIRSSDPGTPKPGKKPVKTEPVDTKPEEPKTPPVAATKPPHETLPEETTTNPSQPEEPATEPQEKPEEIKEEEPKVAFTQEHQEQINIATKTVLDSNDFEPVINDKVKTVAYFATDIAATLASLVLTLVAILGAMDPIVAITINAAVVSALLGFKQTFRISSKKK